MIEPPDPYDSNWLYIIRKILGPETPIGTVRQYYIMFFPEDRAAAYLCQDKLLMAKKAAYAYQREVVKANGLIATKKMKQTTMAWIRKPLTKGEIPMAKAKEEKKGKKKGPTIRSIVLAQLEKGVRKYSMIEKAVLKASPESKFSRQHMNWYLNDFKQKGLIDSDVVLDDAKVKTSKKAVEKKASKKSQVKKSTKKKKEVEAVDEDDDEENEDEDY